jgi:hypothetical protein
MKTQKPVQTNSIYQSLLVIAVMSSMGVAGCSDFARMAEEHAATSYRVATYTDQSKESSDSRHVDSDPEPAYEWFY